MLKTGEAHLKCEIGRKLIGSESYAAEIPVNVLLLGETKMQMILFYSQKYIFSLTLLNSYRQLLPPHIGLPGLRLQDEHASRAEMSVGSLEEPL